MNKKEKTAVMVLGILFLLIIIYAANYLIGYYVHPLPSGLPSELQQVVSNQQCNTYVDCSAILKQQGYSTEQIKSILTVCDKSGCHVIK